MRESRLNRFDFDYWGYFKYCVTVLKISPSEAWRLDYNEIRHLVDAEEKAEQDLSFMLWHKRKMNGATKEWQLSSSL